MSHWGGPSKRRYGRAYAARKKAGDPCRSTTASGQPFLDVDAALVASGLAKK